MLNFLEKICMKFVQRFKIQEYEAFQRFRHGVLFADGTLKPLEKKKDTLRGVKRNGECLLFF